MRINDRNLMGPAASETGRTPETQKLDRTGASSSGAPESGGDRVEFSSSLGRLAQALSSHAAQRSSRVESLAALYQSGGYRADSQATSQSMISEALAAGHE